MVSINQDLLAIVDAALRVLDLVDRDCNDTENEEEGCENGHSDGASTDRVLGIGDVRELAGEGVVVGDEFLRIVIEREGGAVDGVKGWEGRARLLVLFVSSVATNDHEDCGFLLDLVGVTRVWLHDQEVVGVATGQGVIFAVDLDSRRVLRVHNTSVAALGLFKDWQVVAEAD